MAQRIPVTTEAHHTFLTTLSGVQRRVTMRWHPLDGAWYLTIEAADGERLASGLRLVERGRPMRDTEAHLGGEVYVHGVGEPGRRAWDTTHELWWATGEEIEAYEALL